MARDGFVSIDKDKDQKQDICDCGNTKFFYQKICSECFYEERKDKLLKNNGDNKKTKI